MPMMTLRRIIGLPLLLVLFAASAYGQSPDEKIRALTQELKTAPDDESLRRRLLDYAGSRKPEFPVPEEARRLLVRGNTSRSYAKKPGEYARSIQLYKEALEIAPWWAEAYANLAQSFELSNQFNEAINSWNYYLLTRPAKEAARQAQDNIYSLEEKIYAEHKVHDAPQKKSP